MKKLLPTLTIGIPAHNEDNNIRQLLSSLLTQKINNARLSEIIVISDGSHDNTVKDAKSIQSNLLRVIDQKVRKGKPYVVNKIFSLAKSDIIVILDADLIISEEKAIEKLVDPIVKSKNVQLSSALAMHSAPVNFAEKVALASNQIWEKTIQYPIHNELYMCSGSIRAFGKEFSKNIRFPNYSADDAYAFLSCKKDGYDFVHVEGVKILQKVPTTIKDFIAQNTRFIQSQKIQTQLFDENFVNQYYTVSLFDKVRGALWYFSKNPFSTIYYLILRIWISIHSRTTIDNTTSLWTIIRSTKVIT